MSAWVCRDPAGAPRGACWWCPAGVLAACGVPLGVSGGAVQWDGRTVPRSAPGCEVLVRVQGAVWHGGGGELEGPGRPVLCGVQPRCVGERGSTARLGWELWGLGGVESSSLPAGRSQAGGARPCCEALGSLGVTLGPWEPWVTQGQEGPTLWGHSWRGCGVGRVLYWCGHGRLGKGLGCSLPAGRGGGQGRRGSGSTVSPSCHAEMGYKQRFGKKGFNTRDGKQQ